MTDAVLLWVLVAALLVVVLAMAALLRRRNRTVVTSDEGHFHPTWLDEQAARASEVVVVPEQRASATDVAPAPPPRVVPDVADPADPAMTALDPRTPARGVGARAADLLVASLRREGPFAGSVLPGADGASASDPAYRIKASTATHRCYAPESPYYQRTRADLWFRTVDDAERAGFSAS